METMDDQHNLPDKIEKEVQHSPGEQLQISECLKSRLYPYQIEGIEFFHNAYREGRKGVILADEMGLGKSIQVISFLASVARLDKKIPSILLVVPASLLDDWASKIQDWAPSMECLKYHQSEQCQDKNLSKVKRAGGILITTYNTVVRHEKELSYLRSSPYCWDFVVFDEAHKLKNEKTKTYKVALSVQAHIRILLTGTPIQNNLKELWNLLSIISETCLLGTYQTFRKNFENPITRGREADAMADERALAQELMECLKKTIKPVWLRRTKDQLPKLPDKREFVLWIKLTPEQEAIYRHQLSVNEAPDAPSNLLLLHNLRKICCCSRQFDGHDLNSAESKTTHSGKLAILIALLRKLYSEGHKILVFFQYVKTLEIAMQTLMQTDWGQRTVLSMDGTVVLHRRMMLLKSFQNGSHSILLLTVQVGAEGLNLTTADRVIIMEPSWNQSIDAQAVDRVHRIGQRREVEVYRLITCGTVEEKIYRRQLFKGLLARHAVGDDQNPLRHFTRSELMELSSLGETQYSATQLQLEHQNFKRLSTEEILGKQLGEQISGSICGISDHGQLLKASHGEDLEAEMEKLHIADEVQRSKDEIDGEAHLNYQKAFVDAHRHHPEKSQGGHQKGKKKISRESVVKPVYSKLHHEKTPGLPRECKYSSSPFSTTVQKKRAKACPLQYDSDPEGSEADRGETSNSNSPLRDPENADVLLLETTFADDSVGGNSGTSNNKSKSSFADNNSQQTCTRHSKDKGEVHPDSSDTDSPSKDSVTKNAGIVDISLNVLSIHFTSPKAVSTGASLHSAVKSKDQRSDLTVVQTPRSAPLPGNNSFNSEIASLPSTLCMAKLPQIPDVCSDPKDPPKEKDKTGNFMISSDPDELKHMTPESIFGDKNVPGNYFKLDSVDEGRNIDPHSTQALQYDVDQGSLLLLKDNAVCMMESDAQIGEPLQKTIDDANEKSAHPDSLIDNTSDDIVLVSREGKITMTSNTHGHTSPGPEHLAAIDDAATCLEVKSQESTLKLSVAHNPRSKTCSSPERYYDPLSEVHTPKEEESTYQTLKSLSSPHLQPFSLCDYSLTPGCMSVPSTPGMEEFPQVAGVACVDPQTDKSGRGDSALFRESNNSDDRDPDDVFRIGSASGNSGTVNYNEESISSNSHHTPSLILDSVDEGSEADLGDTYEVTRLDSTRQDESDESTAASLEETTDVGSEKSETSTSVTSPPLETCGTPNSNSESSLSDNHSSHNLTQVHHSDSLTDNARDDIVSLEEKSTLNHTVTNIDDSRAINSNSHGHTSPGPELLAATDGAICLEVKAQESTLKLSVTHNPRLKACSSPERYYDPLRAVHTPNQEKSLYWAPTLSPPNWQTFTLCEYSLTPGCMSVPSTPGMEEFPQVAGVGVGSNAVAPQTEKSERGDSALFKESHSSDDSGSADVFRISSASGNSGTVNCNEESTSSNSHHTPSLTLDPVDEGSEADLGDTYEVARLDSTRQDESDESTSPSLEETSPKQDSLTLITDTKTLTLNVPLCSSPKAVSITDNSLPSDVEIEDPGQELGDAKTSSQEPPPIRTYDISAEAQSRELLSPTQILTPLSLFPSPVVFPCDQSLSAESMYVPSTPHIVETPQVSAVGPDGDSDAPQTEKCEGKGGTSSSDQHNSDDILSEHAAGHDSLLENKHVHNTAGINLTDISIPLNLSLNSSDNNRSEDLEAELEKFHIVDEVQRSRGETECDAHLQFQEVSTDEDYWSPDHFKTKLPHKSFGFHLKGKNSDGSGNGWNSPNVHLSRKSANKPIYLKRHSEKTPGLPQKYICSPFSNSVMKRRHSAQTLQSDLHQGAVPLSKANTVRMMENEAQIGEPLQKTTDVGSERSEMNMSVSSPPLETCGTPNSNSESSLSDNHSLHNLTPDSVIEGNEVHQSVSLTDNARDDTVLVSLEEKSTLNQTATNVDASRTMTSNSHGHTSPGPELLAATDVAICLEVKAQESTLKLSVTHNPRSKACSSPERYYDPLREVHTPKQEERPYQAPTLSPPNWQTFTLCEYSLTPGCMSVPSTPGMEEFPQVAGVGVGSNAVAPQTEKSERGDSALLKESHSSDDSGSADVFRISSASGNSGTVNCNEESISSNSHHTPSLTLDPVDEGSEADLGDTYEVARLDSTRQDESDESTSASLEETSPKQDSLTLITDTKTLTLNVPLCSSPKAVSITDNSLPSDVEIEVPGQELGDAKTSSQEPPPIRTYDISAEAQSRELLSPTQILTPLSLFPSPVVFPCDQSLSAESMYVPSTPHIVETPQVSGVCPDGDSEAPQTEKCEGKGGTSSSDQHNSDDILSEHTAGHDSLLENKHVHNTAVNNLTDISIPLNLSLNSSDNSRSEDLGAEFEKFHIVDEVQRSRGETECDAHLQFQEVSADEDYWSPDHFKTKIPQKSFGFHLKGKNNDGSGNGWNSPNVHLSRKSANKPIYLKRHSEKTPGLPQKYICSPFSNSIMKRRHSAQTLQYDLHQGAVPLSKANTVRMMENEAQIGEPLQETTDVGSERSEMNISVSSPPLETCGTPNSNSESSLSDNHSLHNLTPDSVIEGNEVHQSVSLTDNARDDTVLVSLEEKSTLNQTATNVDASRTMTSNSHGHTSPGPELLAATDVAVCLEVKTQESTLKLSVTHNPRSKACSSPERYYDPLREVHTPKQERPYQAPTLSPPNWQTFTLCEYSLTPGCMSVPSTPGMEELPQVAGVGVGSNAVAPQTEKSERGDSALFRESHNSDDRGSADVFRISSASGNSGTVNCNEESISSNSHHTPSLTLDPVDEGSEADLGDTYEVARLDSTRQDESDESTSASLEETSPKQDSLTLITDTKTLTLNVPLCSSPKAVSITDISLPSDVETQDPGQELGDAKTSRQDPQPTINYDISLEVQSRELLSPTQIFTPLSLFLSPVVFPCDQSLSAESMYVPSTPHIVETPQVSGVCPDGDSEAPQTEKCEGKGGTSSFDQHNSDDILSEHAAGYDSVLENRRVHNTAANNSLDISIPYDLTLNSSDKSSEDLEAELEKFHIVDEVQRSGGETECDAHLQFQELSTDEDYWSPDHFKTKLPQKSFGFHLKGKKNNGSVNGCNSPNVHLSRKSTNKPIYSKRHSEKTPGLPQKYKCFSSPFSKSVMKRRQSARTLQYDLDQGVVPPSKANTVCIMKNDAQIGEPLQKTTDVGSQRSKTSISFSGPPLEICGTPNSNSESSLSDNHSLHNLTLDSVIEGNEVHHSDTLTDNARDDTVHVSLEEKSTLSSLILDSVDEGSEADLGGTYEVVRIDSTRQDESEESASASLEETSPEKDSLRLITDTKTLTLNVTSPLCSSPKAVSITDNSLHSNVETQDPGLFENSGTVSYNEESSSSDNSPLSLILDTLDKGKNKTDSLVQISVTETFNLNAPSLPCSTPKAVCVTNGSLPISLYPTSERNVVSAPPHWLQLEATPLSSTSCSGLKMALEENCKAVDVKTFLSKETLDVIEDLNEAKMVLGELVDQSELDSANSPHKPKAESPGNIKAALDEAAPQSFTDKVIMTVTHNIRADLSVTEEENAVIDMRDDCWLSSDQLDIRSSNRSDLVSSDETDQNPMEETVDDVKSVSLNVNCDGSPGSDTKAIPTTHSNLFAEIQSLGQLDPTQTTKPSSPTLPLCCDSLTSKSMSLPSAPHPCKTQQALGASRSPKEIIDEPENSLSSRKTKTLVFSSDEHTKRLTKRKKRHIRLSCQRRLSHFSSVFYRKHVQKKVVSKHYDQSPQWLPSFCKTERTTDPEYIASNSEEFVSSQWKVGEVSASLMFTNCSSALDSAMDSCESDHHCSGNNTEGVVSARVMHHDITENELTPKRECFRLLRQLKDL
ncbi:uncharacterized protein LOC134067487 [Sardina pilchardus]|uniref:uncharacterized protein LOC134067487 n=1 Tax=Sardina pilchardus TaxID=27697 RepID=UPI002E0EF080